MRNRTLWKRDTIFLFPAVGFPFYSHGISSCDMLQLLFMQFSLFSMRMSRISLFLKLQVGNFRVEPPGLFRGRGDHPKVLVFFFSPFLPTMYYFMIDQAGMLYENFHVIKFSLKTYY